MAESFDANCKGPRHVVIDRIAMNFPSTQRQPCSIRLLFRPNCLKIKPLELSWKSRWPTSLDVANLSCFACHVWYLGNDYASTARSQMSPPQLLFFEKGFDNLYQNIAA